MRSIEQPDLREQCVILGKRQENCWLQLILEDAFSEVFVVESWGEVLDIPFTFRPSYSMFLLVVTDTFPGYLDQRLLQQVKDRIYPFLTVCLYEKLDPSLESGLRSIGLTFFGSYGTFLRHVDGIIGHGWKRLAKLSANIDLALPTGHEGVQ